MDATAHHAPVRAAQAAMTDQEQEQLRIRIAEQCKPQLTQMVYLEERPLGYITHDIPDYLNSRDACAQFEATLNSDEQKKYGEKLRAIINQTDMERLLLMPLYSKQPWTGTNVFLVATATPEQRCLAYAKVKGLLSPHEPKRPPILTKRPK